uniref:Putative secreted protein n=1 Tax=Anopheles darlingi TaxID=43151 RepID=A0A2M4DNB7_ANODA
MLLLLATPCLFFTFTLAEYFVFIERIRMFHSHSPAGRRVLLRCCESIRCVRAAGMIVGNVLQKASE